MMRINSQSKISALLMGMALLVASCGGSGDSDNAKTIENALGSLSQGLAIKTEAPAYQVTHSRFIRRMRAEHANNNPLAVKAHLDSLMWHVGDLRKYGAIPDEYAVPLNTALHYVAQLYGTRRAEKARQLGDPPVTAAEFESAVAQLRALVAAAGQGSTQRAALMLVTEDSTGCNTMGEIGEDIGVLLVAGLKSIPVAGQMFGAVTSVLWPINCTKSTTDALQDQINALNVNITDVKLDIYIGFFNTLQPAAFTYRDTVQFSSDAFSILRDLRQALTTYLSQKESLRATGTSDYSAAAALPLYAAYVTQYIALLQDYINYAAAGGECGTASKWCDPLETDATRNQQMCAWKKELLRVTYDYAPTDPDSKTMTLSECYDAKNNPTSEFQIYKADSAKQYVIATMKNGTGIIPAATVSTSNPNLNQVTWNARNAWTRATTLTSQDQAMYWPWMNILVYPPTTDPNDPTATVANVAIPDVVLTRELYSDIVGTIRDKDANAANWDGVSAWLANVTKHQALPYYGPIEKADLWGDVPGCGLFCGYPKTRAWDLATYYAEIKDAAGVVRFHKGGPVGLINPGGSQSVGKDAGYGFSVSVGAPQACDYKSDGKLWTKGDCTLTGLGNHGPFYKFQVRVVEDQDASTYYGIVQLAFWFIDGFNSSDVATDGTIREYDDANGCGYTGYDRCLHNLLPYDSRDGSKGVGQGHMYSSKPLSGDGASTTTFSLPNHVISSITPYGTLGSGGEDKALGSFIVGFRPYNAWGFSN